MRALSRSYTAVRTMLMLGLLAGIYVVVLILLGLEAVLLVPMVQAMSHRGGTLLLSLSEILAAASLPGVMMIVYGVFAMRRSPDGPWVSVPIAREAAPQLWETVEQVAVRVRTRPPTQVHVAAAANAAVSEMPRMLGLMPGPRRLTIGLPLLLGLSESELKVVLAHEMGHYAHGHTRLGARVYLGSVSLRRISQVLGALRESDRRNAFLRAYWRFASIHTRIAYHLFAAYSAFYDAMSLGVRRRQELDADATAVALYGPRATGDALRAVHVLPAAWEQFVGEVLDPMRRAGWVTDDPFSAFEAMLDDPPYKDRLDRLKQSPPEHDSARRDSHPSLKLRLEQLPEPDETENANAPALPAMRLLTVAQRHHASTTLGRAVAVTPSAVMTRTTLTTVPWQRWLERAAAQRVTARSTDLLRCAKRIDGAQDVTLTTVLELLAAGRAPDLEAALADSAGPSQGPAVNTDLLPTALAALVSRYSAGRITATWRLCWTRSDRLIAVGAAAERFQSLADAAVRSPGTQLDALRQALAAAGVDPGDAPPPTDEDWNERRERIAAATSVRIGTVVDVALVDRQARFRSIQITMTGILAVTSLVAFLRVTHPAIPGSSISPYQGPLTLPTPYTGRLAPLTPVFSVPAYPSLILPSKDLLLKFPYSLVPIEPGDNLSSLACRYQTTVATLQSINDMGTSTTIYAGRFLLVPQTPSGSPTQAVCGQ